MSYLISAKNDLDGLKKLLQLVINKGRLNGNYLEILSCLLTLPYHRHASDSFRAFRGQFLNITGQVGRNGWDRATRVYTVATDRATKPSYLKRLLEYPDRYRKADKSVHSINQINTIIDEFTAKPGYSLLSFVFLRPADLIDKFRPGYVPCPLAGDFKFRNGKFHLNVMFRTNDAFAIGYADIFYLRELQRKVLYDAKKISSNEKIHRGEIGDLHLYFSRTYIERSRKIRDKETGVQKSVKIIPLAAKLIKELNGVSL